jgi:hypothetical protein
MLACRAGVATMKGELLLGFYAVIVQLGCHIFVMSVAGPSTAHIGRLVRCDLRFSLVRHVGNS